jgi:hypothetical protein
MASYVKGTGRRSLVDYCVGYDLRMLSPKIRYVRNTSSAQCSNGANTTAQNVVLSASTCLAVPLRKLFARVKITVMESRRHVN